MYAPSEPSASGYLLGCFYLPVFAEIDPLLYRVLFLPSVFVFNLHSTSSGKKTRWQANTKKKFPVGQGRKEGCAVDPYSIAGHTVSVEYTRVASEARIARKIRTREKGERDRGKGTLKTGCWGT